jgi:hypothetical protein
VSTHQVLVVGSYPPIPVPAAAATVEAVRRAWDTGGEVTVVSPRLSAAHLALPVVGILAGHRLANLRRHTSASHLVLVLERGLPVPATGDRGLAARVVQWQTVTAMVRAFRSFDRVTLVRVGALDIPPRFESRLMHAAGEIIEHAGGPMATAPGITVLGPVETPPRERPRQIAEAAARRAMGRYAGPARARVRAALRR